MSLLNDASVTYAPGAYALALPITAIAPLRAQRAGTYLKEKMTLGALNVLKGGNALNKSVFASIISR